jgi:hypothetical protein
MSVCVLVFVEDYLNYSFAVAEVYESQRAEVTSLVNPSHEPHDFSRVLRPEFARIVTAL